MVSLLRARFILTGILIVVLAVALACGEEATPTPTPTAAPTATPDVGAAVQQAVQQAIAAMPTPAPGISPEDIPSIDDIASLVQAAVAAAAPEGTSAEQIQAMVRAAVEAAAQPGITREDLNAVVRSAVDAAVSQAIARITPVATPAMTAMPTPTPAATTTPTGTFNVGFIELGPPIHVPYNQGYLTNHTEHLAGTHDPMTALTADGKIEPRLVSEWEFDHATSTYTFKLQRGVKWNDPEGRDWGEFNADDFLWTMDVVTKEGSTHAESGTNRRVYKCDGCTLTKLDDYTIQLKRPAPSFEPFWYSTTPKGSVLTFHSKKHFEAMGEEAANQRSVGTGSYVLLEARTGEFRRMKAVPNHWRYTPEWDQMIWWEVGEESTRLANFLSGTLDTGIFTLEAVQAIKQENLPGVKFMSFPGAIMQYLLLGGQQYYPDHPAHHPTADGKPARVPLGEGVDYQETCKTVVWVACDRDESSAAWEKALKVRQAMTLAIDRQKLVNAQAFGDGAPAYHYLWGGKDARRTQLGLDELVWPYDPARARQLLAEAGYPGDIDVELSLVARPAPGAPEMGQGVATMWEDVGIRAQMANVPYATWRPGAVRRTDKVISTQNSPGSGFEPLAIYNLFHSASSGLNFGFEHPSFQELLEKAFVTFDDEERWQVQADMARWIFDNAMVLGVFQADSVWPLSPRIDEWETLSTSDWLSAWERVPHRK